MNNNTPIVSILCITYNHEKYIRECLEGFVKQKTTFPFEVIIHDDASTDKTPSIIHEFELKYPNIIRPIYQKVNQWSQGKWFVREFIFPKIRGKYIALCEGDDYWCSSQKLEKQVDILESKPNCHLCVHRVMQIQEDGKMTKHTMPNFKLKDGIYFTNEFLRLDEGHNFQTTSYFFRYDDYMKYTLFPPAFRFAAKVGDVQMLLYFSSLGDVYFIDDIMSCHRQASKGSWSERMNKASIERKVNHLDSIINTFKMFDDYTNKKYHEVIQHRINRTLFDKMLILNQYREALNNKYKDYFGALTFKQKMSIYIGALSPNLLKKIRSILKKC